MATERNPELRSAWEFVEHTGTSIFLTGKAGTGKTTFLRTVVARSTKQMVVVAPTGVAAINAGGMTIHSFFQLPLSPYVPGADVKKMYEFGKEKRKIISSMDLLIIDEISMVRSDLLDAIDSVLRRYRDHNKPFGGVQLLMIGDLAQLTPVVTPEDEELLRPYYDTPYFFGSKALQQINYVTIQLKKIYRQADTTFVDLLNHIREGHPTAEDIATLHQRYNPTFMPDAKDGYIRLTTPNRMADEYNDHEMQRLSSQPFTYSAVIDGTFPDYSYPTAFYLTLKVGAQVMFIKNDVNGEYYNGKIGHVVALDNENIKVRCIGEDNDIDVGMQDWENAKYTINPETHEIETDVQGTFSQYPLRLAWAITIHKSQGLTFRNVTVDFTGGTFAGGQAYVALSRCTSLDGLTLKRRLTRSDIFVRPEIVNFARQFNDQHALEHALRFAKADNEYRACCKAFDRGDMQECLDHFFIAIHTRYDIERPQAKRLIRRKLNVFRKLRDDRDEMRRQLDSQNEKLERLAKEFVSLGDQCVTEAHNVKAALANYNKAIDLSPRLFIAWVRRGVTLADSGKLDDALRDLNQAVALSPRSFKAIYNRGRVFMQKQLWAEAINDLTRATSLKEKNPKPYHLLGDAYSRMGDEEKALLYWELARRLEKGSSDNVS